MCAMFVRPFFISLSYKNKYLLLLCLLLLLLLLFSVSSRAPFNQLNNYIYSFVFLLFLYFFVIIFRIFESISFSYFSVTFSLFTHCFPASMHTHYFFCFVFIFSASKALYLCNRSSCFFLLAKGGTWLFFNVNFNIQI